jgi:hypothetical protein
MHEQHLEVTIRQFRDTLPGWWYSLGECDISCDASCAPTDKSPDIALIPADERFNSGFHADVPQPSTLAQALLHVMSEAVAARAATMGGSDD